MGNKKNVAHPTFYYSQENLLKIKNIISTLFLAENNYDMEQLEQELVKLFQMEPDKQAVSLFLNWFKQLAIHGRIDKNDYSSLEKVYTTTQEVSMLLTSLRQERQTLYQNGVTQGITKTAKRMLDENIDISLITKVTQLSKREILQLNTEQKKKS
ncbi:MAG: hypothetical protein DRQ49_02655 [Gammaproteobacteria bacterium]|nr:MAG: hypothetical protein DRQ49_02655 [Gammaproteobacteria bacterium]RKZ76332.1 MAG: hypothetical protein DRQ57_04265 [Gammaproteobacteria bacterium]